MRELERAAEDRPLREPDERLLALRDPLERREDARWPDDRDPPLDFRAPAPDDLRDPRLALGEPLDDLRAPARLRDLPPLREPAPLRDGPVDVEPSPSMAAPSSPMMSTPPVVSFMSSMRSVSLSPRAIGKCLLVPARSRNIRASRDCR